MSSSESEDEELERLRAAVAPNFSIGVADSANSIDPANSENSPPTNGHGKLGVGSNVDVLGEHARPAKYSAPPDKPSLRPDKQKESNSADTLDLDGFTPQFKDHISKKLKIKLDAGISLAKGEDSGDDMSKENSALKVDKCVNENNAMPEEEEDDGLALISVFSSSAIKSFVLPSDHETMKAYSEKRKRSKKRRETSLGENLKQIHLSKKIRAVKAVVRAETLGRERLNGDLDDDDDDCRSEKEEEEEEEKRLSSMAVSGEAILSASMIGISDKNSAAAATKKKKKKKKKKTVEGDDGDGAVECKELNGEEANDESHVAPESKTDVNSESCLKKYKRKKKGKQERLKARLRLEQGANGVAPAEVSADGGN